MRYRIVVALLLGLCSLSVCAESGESFRIFLRTFFTDAQFQKQRVSFPVEWQELVSNNDPVGEPFITRKTRKTSANWQHIKGPAFFDCKTDCYDLVTYDNFKRQDSKSSERVVTFEGVNNGISRALFFRQVQGKWMLVRYVDEST